MVQFIIVFGMLTCLAGIVILFNPEIVFAYLRKNTDKIGLHLAAVVLRLMLGVLLVNQSAASKYPLIIEIIGWLSIVAAICFAVIGRDKFIRLMGWALSQVKTLGRVGGVIATGFGIFLMYAFV